MNTGNWIELAALVVTILGGGGVGVSKLTRIAVVLEEGGKTLQALGKLLADTSGTVAAHTTQLAVQDEKLSAHDTRLAVLEQPKSP